MINQIKYGGFLKYKMVCWYANMNMYWTHFYLYNTIYLTEGSDLFDGIYFFITILSVH